VTGIVVNEKLNIDRRDIRRIRAMLDSWSKLGLAGAQARFVERDRKDRHPGAEPAFPDVLWGLISYLAQVRGPADSYVQLFRAQFKNLKNGRDPEYGIKREFFPQPRAVPVRPEERVVAIMFSDIVGSTEIAEAKGDKAWRGLLDKHDRLSLQFLSRYRGYRVDTTGDGFVATFDSPRAAISCGLAFAAAVKELRLNVRIGIHAASVMLGKESVQGIGVHLAKRVCDKGSAGQVCVSQTVHDIELGSAYVFNDLGLKELKGVEGKWRLYEVEDG
jgi:class 3 adenylate cyclase